MRKLVFIALELSIIILIACSSDQKFSGTFSFRPSNPSPGDEITIRYVADSTKLAGLETIDLAAYFYNNDLIEAVSVELEKKKDGWYGNIAPPEDAYGILIKFVNDEISDNNNSKGYLINLYGKDGKMFPGSKAGYAAAGMRWGKNYLELKMEGEEALQLFNEDFKNNPELKTEFISPYLGSIIKTFPDKTDSILTSELAILEAKKNLSENELQYLTGRFETPPFDAPIKSEKYYKMLEKGFPKNDIILNKEYGKVYDEQDLAKKTDMANEFVRKFPDYEYNSYLYFSVGAKVIASKNLDSIYQFGKEYLFKVHPAFYDRAVTKLLDEEGTDINKLLMVSDLGVQASRNQIKNHFIPKQKSETNTEYNKTNDYLLSSSLYSNARVLYKLEKYDIALPIIEESIAKLKDVDQGAITLYINVLFKLKDYSKLTEKAEVFIKEGKSSPEIVDDLKNAYLIKHGSDKDFELYLSKLEEKAKALLTEKLKKEIISVPAPQFTLKDLKGNSVSLSDLKGKTVILDFWATWCGPCVSSFPGMQMMVNKYKDNPNVKFLFVNSWERVENPLKNASDFIKKNNYNFQVLLDDENKVIGDYDVAGIPTKFIIDNSGNIRFKSVGFDGTAEGLVEEVSTMIEMVR